jgi:signal transduction histidine kinase
MPAPRRPRGKLAREAAATAAIVATLALLIIGLVVIGMARTHRDALAAGRTRAATLARLLEEQTRRTVQAVDLTLLNVSDALRRTPDMPSHDPRMTKRLRARLAELPYVRALFVIGADGHVIQDTDSDTPDVSLADRAYFRTQVDNPKGGLYIGEPLRSRSRGAPWFLAMSRRITLEDGRFYGVAVAAVEPRYFARFYADIQAGKGGSVALIHRSGLMIARYPDYDRAIGLSLADTTLFGDLLPAAPSGTYREASVVDGVERLFSYRALAPLPLVVVVGLSDTALLSGWRDEVRLSGGITAAVLLAIVAGALMFLRRRAGELLSAERLQQIEKTEALGRMTTSVAHDFNNLLTVIGGNIEMIAAGLAADDSSKRRAQTALDAVERGERIVSQLLAFARREPLAASLESPGELIGNMSDLLRQAVHPCALRLAVAADCWRCRIDPGQLERAVLNLAVNARDAMAKGGEIVVAVVNVPRRELDRAAWPDLAAGDYIACEVRDNGGGMPPDILRRACEPFFTTKPEGRGTGLGLSQAYGFARQSGGGVRITSKVGAGTTVTLLLPRSSVPPAE